MALKKLRWAESKLPDPTIKKKSQSVGKRGIRKDEASASNVVQCQGILCSGIKTIVDFGGLQSYCPSCQIFVSAVSSIVNEILTKQKAINWDATCSDNIQ